MSISKEDYEKLITRMSSLEEQVKSNTEKIEKVENLVKRLEKAFTDLKTMISKITVSGIKDSVSTLFKKFKKKDNTISDDKIIDEKK